MPRVHRQMSVPTNMKPLDHDPQGRLSGFHVEALSIVFGAQFLQPPDPSNPQYVRAMLRAIACTENARAGWLAIRSPKYPAGDKEGAGKSAVAIAGFEMELERLGNAMRWLITARKELGYAFTNELDRNVNFVLAHIDDAYEIELQRLVLISWRDALRFWR